MKIEFNQQNLQDAVILFAEERTEFDREELQAELLLNDNQGFHARIFLSHNDGGTDFMNQQDVIDSVAFYLMQEHNFRPEDLSIELFYDEENGFTANVIVN